MAFCTQCGREAMEADLFCSKCGAALKKDASGSDDKNHPPPVADKVDPPLHYKGVGIRFIAQLFDFIPLGILYFWAGNIIASMYGGSTPEGFELYGNSALGLIVLMLIVTVLYFTALERWWNGQSLGKKIVGITVVNSDGSPISLSSSLIRNVFRLIDGVLFYLVGAIFIWRSDAKQRLGDRMAGAVVIRKVKDKRSSKKFKLVFGEKDPSMIDTFD